MLDAVTRSIKGDRIAARLPLKEFSNERYLPQLCQGRPTLGRIAGANAGGPWMVDLLGSDDPNW
jgi:hypothetical protein